MKELTNNDVIILPKMMCAKCISPFIVSIVRSASKVVLKMQHRVNSCEFSGQITSAPATTLSQLTNVTKLK